MVAPRRAAPRMITTAQWKPAGPMKTLRRPSSALHGVPLSGRRPFAGGRASRSIGRGSGDGPVERTDVSGNDHYPTVNGETRLLGVVGHPIAQVLAPALWENAFRVSTLNIRCVPLHVRPDDLIAFLDGVRRLRNLDGLLITVPHKTAVVDVLARRSERAHAVFFGFPLGAGSDPGVVEIVRGLR
jgi:hypothetical protein